MLSCKRSHIVFTQSVILIAMVLFPLANSSAARNDETFDARIYHWARPRFTAYQSAHFIEYPNGDIDPRRAFYWGRVIGSDGLMFGIRYLAPQLIEGNWIEPAWQNEKEKEYICKLVKEFEDLYSKYGCGDNIMTVTAHPLLPNHRTHSTKDVAQWRQYVVEGMRQRAQLCAIAGVPRILLDLEWSKQNKVSTDFQFWYELGADIAAVMREVNPNLKFGFYPGLTGVQVNLENKTVTKGVGPRENTRVALLQGIYDNLGTMKMWHFVGWTYFCNDLTTADPFWVREPPYVKNADKRIEQVMFGHKMLLGHDIEYVWGRKTFGGRWRYVASGELREKTRSYKSCYIKSANLSLEVLERTYKKYLAASPAIGQWQLGPSWDEDGWQYLNATTPAVMAEFRKAVATPEDGIYSHRNYDARTGKYWIRGVMSKNLEARLELFEIIEKDDKVHITGKLDEDFPKYVNLVRRLSGKTKKAFPLYTEKEIQLARSYQSRGFLSGLKIYAGPDET